MATINNPKIKNDLTLCRNEIIGMSYIHVFGMHKTIKKNQELSMLWSVVVLTTGCFYLIIPKTKLGYDIHIILDFKNMG
jgi:hypothetical protein